MKKLQNKFTGEIGRLSVDIDKPDNGIRVYGEDGVTYSRYNSIAELNEHWEDYEEPEVYYYISDFGAICEREIGKFPEDEKDRKKIGNYFETLEEAKKAREKIKALKRLENKGLTFYDWVWDYTPTQTLKITASIAFHDGIEEDLDLLFGGE